MFFQLAPKGPSWGGEVLTKVERIQIDFKFARNWFVSLEMTFTVEAHPVVLFLLIKTLDILYIELFPKTDQPAQLGRARLDANLPHRPIFVSIEIFSRK
jgi:hypothetical protein